MITLLVIVVAVLSAPLLVHLFARHTPK